MNVNMEQKKDNRNNNESKTDQKNSSSSSYGEKNADSGAKKFDGSASHQNDIPPVVSKTAENSKAAPSEKK